MVSKLSLSRRDMLAGGLTAGVAACAPGALLARIEDVAYAISQDFGRIEPLPGGIDIDLPTHSDAGTVVPLTISMPGQLTPEAYPKLIRLYGSENPRPRIASLSFTPQCGQAFFSTRIRLQGAQNVVAVAENADGTFNREDRKVTVAFGACAAAGNSDDLPEDWQPQIRLSVPETASAGEIVDIRTIITHPMETGLRLNATTQYVPRRIIESMTCLMDGVQVFRAKLEPAISTNPFIAFKLRIDRSCRLTFDWVDTNGSTYHREAEVVVS